MTGKRMFTVMVIPHSEKPPITLKIPLFLIQSFFVLTILIVFFIILWGLQYAGMKKEMQSLKSKALQTNTLNKEFAAVTEQVFNLQTQLDQMRQTEASIRAQTLPSKKEKEPEVVTAQEWPSLGEQTGKSINQVLAFSVGDTEKVLDQMLLSSTAQSASYQSLLEQIQKKSEKLAHIPSIYPALGRLTSRFGYRKDPFTGRSNFHPGLDIANSINTPIYAAADGIVVRTGRVNGYGNQIMINHGNGIVTTYSHLYKIKAKENESVVKGQLIGYMGSTGRSTGPHLHYEVHVNNELVNPIKYLPN